MEFTANKTMLKYNDAGQPNCSMDPFKHYHNEVYVYLGELPPAEGKSAMYLSQFMRVRRLRDKHEFVVQRKSFVDIKTKTTKKK